jgi:hypothetical protein
VKYFYAKHRKVNKESVNCTLLNEWLIAKSLINCEDGDTFCKIIFEILRNWGGNDTPFDLLFAGDGKSGQCSSSNQEFHQKRLQGVESKLVGGAGPWRHRLFCQ